MTPEKPHRHDTAADAVHDGRPVDAELVRSGRKNPRIAVILAVSTLAAAVLLLGLWFVVSPWAPSYSVWSVKCGTN